MKRALIIFLKNPEPGEVKTRLCPRFTHEQAASLYRALAEDVVQAHGSHQGRSSVPPGYDIFIFYSPGDAHDAIRAWLGGDLEIMAQEGGDLGERQYNAFRRVFDHGYERVLIIGTDCLDISPEDLKQAFEVLGRHGLVIGPSEDGGYYLMGTCRAPEFLREGIAWGTLDVLEQLLERARRTGLECHLIGRKSDIDTCDDVDRLYASLKGGELREKAPRTLPVLEKLMGDLS